MECRNVTYINTQWPCATYWASVCVENYTICYNNSDIFSLYNYRKISFRIKFWNPHKILKPNPDPEYYNKEVKRLKVKVRKAYNRRKLGANYQAELKRLSKKLLSAKRNAQEIFLSSVLQNEGKSWLEFYRFVNRQKGNRENIPAMGGKSQIP